MATLTISLTSTPITGSRTWTVSDADVTTLITYMQTKFSQNGTISLTPLQALLAWVNGFVNGTVGEIQNFQARQQAQALVVPTLTFV